jgi:hypothetical protein
MTVRSKKQYRRVHTVNENGETQRPVTSDLVFNALMATHRQSGPPPWLFRRSGGANIESPGRDLDKECGYIEFPTIEQYLKFYTTVGVANRAVNIWPDECWAAYPDLYQNEGPNPTRFERAWDDLNRNVLAWHYLHRIDRLSGIGQFGLLFFGISDGLSLDQPVKGLDAMTGKAKDGRKPLDLLYLRAFDEASIQIFQREGNPRSPRFGQPVLYNITFYDPNTQGNLSTDGNLPENATTQMKVHWTRTLHIADNRMTSEIFGIPRLRPVLSNVQDIRKVSGSSAEMFFKGGFPGYQFRTDPGLGADVELISEDDIRDNVEAYMNGLVRYLTAVGGQWESLAPQVADPSNNLTQQLTLLCLTLGVPLRIFIGSEAGHLASTQDAGTWKERLRGRQLNYLQPWVVNPFVERLMEIGALPRVKRFLINWRDLQTLGDKDRADVGLKRAQSIMQYITSGGNQLISPMLFFTLVLGMTDREAQAVVKDIKDNPPKKLLQSPVKPALAGAKAGDNPAGGGRVGNPPAADVGSPGTK